MKDSIVQQCLDILKRDDVKNEFKMLFKPVIDFILFEIKQRILLKKLLRIILNLYY